MNTNRRFKRNCKRKQGELMKAVWMWSIVSDEGRKVKMEDRERREQETHVPYISFPALPYALIFFYTHANPLYCSLYI